MQKGDPLSAGAYARLRINDAQPRASQILQRLLQFGNREGDMMKTRPSPFEKPRDGRVRCGSFQQFHLAITRRKEDRLYLLVGHDLLGATLLSEQFPENRRRRLDRFHGYGNVMYFHQSVSLNSPQLAQ